MGSIMGSQKIMGSDYGSNISVCDAIRSRLESKGPFWSRPLDRSKLDH
jgi:hypothetical protein